jgi:hypothetical protein
MFERQISQCMPRWNVAIISFHTRIKHATLARELTDTEGIDAVSHKFT